MYALTTAGVENACCEFDVATLRPTYRLLIGVPGKSNAFAISQKLGLPDAILERAREFLSNESVAFEDVLQSIEKDRAAAEEARRRTEGARLEAERLAGELERRKRAADAQKEAILREARESAKRLLAESKADAEAILARLRKLEEEDDAQARKAEATELRHRLKSRIDKVDESLAYRMPAAASAGTGASTRPPKRLRAGDDVFLADLDQAATVVSPPDKDGNVAVRAGIITINTHISNLRAARGRGGGSGVDYGGGYGDGSDGDGNGGSRNSGGYGGGGYGGSDGDGNGGSRNGGDGEGGSRNGKARWSGDSVGGNSGWGSVGASSRADGRPPGLRALNLRAELDLRGERLEEAIARVDRYLDDAALTGLHEVTLIHGKGTGALRAGIQTFLRKHPRAKSFRNGAYGEGDLGVTVVELA
jgi:dsDNA-specific endonuclease/ATPase MutS2